MKAVIMAGGEGTRLRPLTSNQPKPMLPMANGPMMEHVVNLLRSTASRTSWSRWPSWPTPSAPTSATARSSASAWCTPPSRRRSARPARFATPATARRAVPRHLGGRAHRHRPDRGGASSTRSSGALATMALKAVDEPARVRDRHHHARTVPIERFLEKPTWGQVFSDTINTGIYVLEPEIFDFIPERAGRSTSPATSFPAVLAAGKPLLRIRRRRLLGGRGDPRGVPEGPSGHHGRQGAGGRRRVPAPARGLARQGRRGRPERRASTVRRSSGPTARVGPGASLGSVLRPRAEHPDRRQCRPSQRSVVHDNSFLGRGGEHRRQRPRPLL